MAIDYKGPGNWSIGDYRLPEFGLTELLPFTKDKSVEDALVREQMSEGSEPQEVSLPGGNITSESVPNMDDYFTDYPSTSSTSTSSDDTSSSTGGYDADALAESIGMSKDEARAKYPGLTMPEIVAKYKSDAQARAEKKRQQAKEIGKAWDPVLAELDRQLESLPLREQKTEERVEDIEKESLEALSESEKAARQELEGTRKRGLRDLEEDVRNQMEAAGRFLGGYGAGSSSANIQATEAITRAGQRSRGELMESLAGEIRRVQQTAMQERSKLKGWKSQKLLELSEFFNDRLNQLNMAKAQAKGDRKKAIEQLEFDVQKELSSELSALENQVLNYSMQVDMWEKNRQAQLEDYARKAAASGASATEMTEEAISYFNALTDAGLSDAQAKTYMEQQGLIFPQGIKSEEEEPTQYVYKTTKDADNNPILLRIDPTTGQTQYQTIGSSSGGLLDKLF